MRKRLVGIIMTMVFTLGLGTLAYAGSSTVFFNGSGGSIFIVTSAPGISVDNFGVTSEGDLSAYQALSTSSPTVISRQGEFSGGGSILVVTNSTGPNAEVAAYLASDGSGYLAEIVTAGSSAKFVLEAGASGQGDLQIIANSPGMMDFSFGLIFDYSAMSVIANARLFDMAWITSFDNSVSVSGEIYAD